MSRYRISWDFNDSKVWKFMKNDRALLSLSDGGRSLRLPHFQFLSTHQNANANREFICLRKDQYAAITKYRCLCLKFYETSYHIFMNIAFRHQKKYPRVNNPIGYMFGENENLNKQLGANFRKYIHGHLEITYKKLKNEWIILFDKIKMQFEYLISSINIIRLIYVFI